MKMKTLALIAISMCFAACSGSNLSSNSTNSTSNNSQASKNIRVGFAMATVKEERWQRDHDAFAKRCAELGIECPITVADNSSSRQSNDGGREQRKAASRKAARFRIKSSDHHFSPSSADAQVRMHLV